MISFSLHYLVPAWLVLEVFIDNCNILFVIHDMLSFRPLWNDIFVTKQLLIIVVVVVVVVRISNNNAIKSMRSLDLSFLSSF
jgi:hypothetical protein